jgi:hypothetical protein
VLDRTALESRVCECYACVKTELERLVPRHVPTLVMRAPLRHRAAEAEKALVATAHAAAGHLRTNARAPQTAGRVV